METVERKRLTGWDDTSATDEQNMNMLGVRAHLFGELAALATPLIKMYHSDLYHDANWIREWVNGPMTSMTAARRSGRT